MLDKHWMNETCPYCEHDDIRFENDTVDGEQYQRASSCSKCNLNWDAIYHISGYIGFHENTPTLINENTITVELDLNTAQKLMQIINDRHCYTDQESSKEMRLLKNLMKQEMERIIQLVADRLVGET